MDWINIDLSIDGAWDVIWLVLFVLALLTSSGFLITWIRSLITKKTETNKLETIKVVQQQVDLLEDQIQSLVKEVKRLFNTGEETKLHKIELMKANIILHDNVDKLKQENKDLSKQNELLAQQNLLLIEQIKELKYSKEFLKKEIKLLKDENVKLKDS